MSERAGDGEALQTALELIRSRFPEAISASFQTSDQDFVGFELAGVSLADEYLEAGRSVELDALAAEVWPLLSGIGWDGVMRESRLGEVTLET